MSLTTTEWFPPSVLPVHVGAYQRDWGCEYLTSTIDWFDGTRWWIINGEIANESLNYLPWRGLAENPDAEIAAIAPSENESNAAEWIFAWIVCVAFLTFAIGYFHK